MKRSGFTRKATKPLKKTPIKKVSKTDIRRLQLDCDALYQKVGKKMFPKSIVSGKPTEVIHHFYTKQSSNRLRYDFDNAIPLTNAEHFAHHIKSDPTIHATVINKKGQNWYEMLTRKKQESIKVNEAYYKYVLEMLNNA